MAIEEFLQEGLVSCFYHCIIFFLNKFINPFCPPSIFCSTSKMLQIRPYWLKMHPERIITGLKFFTDFRKSRFFSQHQQKIWRNTNVSFFTRNFFFRIVRTYFWILFFLHKKIKIYTTDLERAGGRFDIGEWQWMGWQWHKKRVFESLNRNTIFFNISHVF